MNSSTMISIWRRWTISGLLLAIIVFLAVNILPQSVEAKWSEICEGGDATFEIVPLESRIHATLSCKLVNLDTDTLYQRAYYYSWATVIPSTATNITVYDQSTKLTFTLETHDYWTIITVSLGKQLFFGDKYSLTVAYDLPVPNGNQVVFTTWTPRGSWTSAIVVPRDYYDDISLNPKQYAKETVESKTFYKYFFYAATSTPVTVEVAHRGVPITQSASVNLREKSVSLKVSLWEGEEKNIVRIIDLYSASLPVLETITGMSFQYNYPITITEGTTLELRGYAGQNGGQEGIKVLWSSKTEGTLIHELSHDWADRSHWAEAWMREGQASLYVYLTLNQLGKDQAALDYANYRTANYDKGKESLDIPLTLWSVPESYSGQEIVDFGYGKSYVFMFKKGLNKSPFEI